MKCPKCGADDDKVVDSRSVREGAAIRRRRECTACGCRYTTFEETMPDDLTVVKTDGRRQPFERDKVDKSIRRACGKRPVGDEQIRSMIDRVLAALPQGGEVASSVIASLVMNELHKTDEVAYVRFASVYRKFTDVAQFVAEITEISKKMNSFTHGASPVRVAIVGLGRATFSEHVPYFEGARDLFKVVAACDVSRERRTMLAKSFPKCKMFRRYDDMLDERDIELVLVATPTENHLGQAVAALQRKFWTVVETPMATTHKGALQLKGSSAAADHKLLPLQRGVFAPDFMAAAAVARDERIGMLHGISIRKCDYIRRNDWCTVKRLGGGALLCEATDMFVQILRLLPVPPVQLWSETKRIAATGDTEDYFHVRFKTRSPLTADVEYDGGCMLRGSIPSFAIKGDRGFFYIMPDMGAGELTAVAPGYKFPRRRSSVRTPPLRDMHEQFPESTFRISAPAGTEKGIAAFWSAVFSTVRNAAPFPIQIEESCDAIRLACIIKESSVFRS